ncbi:MAG: hypothetical protein ACR5LB_09420 [Wolbachia sp.]
MRKENRISKLENEVDELKKRLAEKEVQESLTINITGPVKQTLPTLFPARGSEFLHTLHINPKKNRRRSR